MWVFFLSSLNLCNVVVCCLSSLNLCNVFVCCLSSLNFYNVVVSSYIFRPKNIYIYYMSSCYEPSYNNVTIYQSWASTICFAPMSIAEVFNFFKKFLVFSRQSAKRRNAGPQSHRDVFAPMCKAPTIMLHTNTPSDNC